MTPAELIAAEDQLVQLWRDGEVNALSHFCGSKDGQYEEWMCAFFAAHIRPTDYVLGSHRCHYAALLHGIPLDEVKEMVRRGRSMFIYAPRFICSAIVAGTAGIAAGLALAAKLQGTGQKVFCFLGDGAEDQGSAYEAIWFVEERGLPCTFIIEDNSSSCGVSREQRRGSDRQRPWPGCVRRVSYESKYPHAGTVERPVLKSMVPAV